MSNWIGFLFGNVSENGKVEDVDSETEEYLSYIQNGDSSVEKKESSLGKVDLGIEDDDIVNEDGEELTTTKTNKRSNGKKGKGKKSVNVSGVIEKAPDAIDFEDETEVIEDEDFNKNEQEQYYQKALSSIPSTQSIQLTTTKKDKPKETNYDEDYDDEGTNEDKVVFTKPIENGTHTLPPLSLPIPLPLPQKDDITFTTITDFLDVESFPRLTASILEDFDDIIEGEEEIRETEVSTSQTKDIVKPSPISKAIKIFTQLMLDFNNNKNANNNNNASSNNNNNNAKILPPEKLRLLRAICSSVKTTSPILRFSEIFTPRQHEIHKRLPRPSFPEPPLNEGDLEKNQENIFFEGAEAWSDYIEKIFGSEEASAVEGQYEEHEHDTTTPQNVTHSQTLKVTAIEKEKEDVTITQDETLSSLSGLPLRESVKEDDLKGFQVPEDTSFHIIEQGHWEDDILWDDPQNLNLPPHKKQRKNKSAHRYLLSPSRNITPPPSPKTQNSQTDSIPNTNTPIFITPHTTHIDEDNINTNFVNGSQKKQDLLDSLLDQHMSFDSDNNHNITTDIPHKKQDLLDSLLDQHMSFDDSTNSNNATISTNIFASTLLNYNGTTLNSHTTPLTEIPQVTSPTSNKTDSQQNNTHSENNSQNHTTTTQPIIHAPEWSKFPIPNFDIESDSWLQNIIWDEKSAPKSKAPLILDLNDENMLFGGPNSGRTLNPLTGSTTRPTTRQTAKRSRRPLPTQNTTSTSENNNNNVIIPREEGKDMFNLSNDRYYKQPRIKTIRHQSARTPVSHSIPALKLSMVKTNLTSEELSNFHRPRSKFTPQQTFKIVPSKEKAKKNKKGRVDQRVMKHKSELTAKDGRVVLVEFIEEQPPLIQNVGMASRIRSFYRKENAQDARFQATDDGDTVLLEPNDESPFLGDINPAQSVQSIINELYKVPIQQHSVPTTDFLLVKTGNQKFSLREFSSAYTAGQLQPLTEVPTPNSRLANNFQRNRLAAYVFRQFLKKENPTHKLKIQDITAKFPTQTEGAVRKKLKECAEFQRGGDDSGAWIMKVPPPSEEELRKLVYPEVACAYEAMLAGQQHLIDRGILRLTNPETVTQALQSLSSTDPLKKKGEPLEQDLLMSPWTQTSNFIEAMLGKMKLQLSAQGDDDFFDIPNIGPPTSSSGIGIGKDLFSYMKMPQKEQNKRQKKLKAALKDKQSVTGTRSDLRKLSLEEAAAVLRDFGVSDEQIAKMSRWNRIALVREKSSEAALSGGGETRFARGMRFSFEAQTQRYRDAAQAIFEAQLATLNLTERDFAEIDREEQFSEFGKDLEDLLNTESTKEEPKNVNANTNSNSNTNTNTTSTTPPTATANVNANVFAPRPTSTTTTTTTTNSDINDEEEEAAFQKLMAQTQAPAPSVSTPQTAAPSTPLQPHISVTTPIFTEPPSPIPKTPSTPISTTEIPEDPTKTQATGAPLKKDRKVKSIKRTITARNPDGTETKHVEYISDPAIIAEILASQTHKVVTQPPPVQPSSPPPPPHKPLTPEEIEIQNQKRRQKKKLEEELKRLAAAEAQLGGGEIPLSAIPHEMRRCGNCGLIGHLRNSPVCPFNSNSVIPTTLSPVQSPTNSNQTVKDSGLLKTTGTKLSISRKILNVAPAPEKFKIKLSGSLVMSHMKKRRREEEEEEEMEKLTSPRLQSRGPRQRVGRSGRGADVELNSIFERILTDVIRNVNTAFIFIEPVSKQDAPDYYDVVLHPMCLSDMKQKAVKLQYMSREHFVKDAQLIVDNCHLYNDNTHKRSNVRLPPTAHRMYDELIKRLDDHKADIGALEIALTQNKLSLSTSSSSINNNNNLNSSSSNLLPNTPISPLHTENSKSPFQTPSVPSPISPVIYTPIQTSITESYTPLDDNNSNSNFTFSLKDIKSEQPDNDSLLSNGENSSFF